MPPVGLVMVMLPVGTTRRAEEDEPMRRGGHHPGRFEAESMKLEGYTVRDVTPWEAASGGKAVSCPVARCAATLHYQGPAGWYTINVRDRKSTRLNSSHLGIS